MPDTDLNFGWDTSVHSLSTTFTLAKAERDLCRENGETDNRDFPFSQITMGIVENRSRAFPTRPGCGPRPPRNALLAVAPRTWMVAETPDTP